METDETYRFCSTEFNRTRVLSVVVLISYSYICYVHMFICWNEVWEREAGHTGRIEKLSCLYWRVVRKV